jgi:hypothetical protein
VRGLTSSNAGARRRSTRSSWRATHDSSASRWRSRSSGKIREAYAIQIEKRHAKKDLHDLLQPGTGHGAASRLHRGYFNKSNKQLTLDG